MSLSTGTRSGALVGTGSRLLWRAGPPTDEDIVREMTVDRLDGILVVSSVTGEVEFPEEL